MQTLNLNLISVPGIAPSSTNLEVVVKNFITEWHNEDNLQEVLNMALMANQIPANVIKVGGPSNALNFEVVPFPDPRKNKSFTGKKLAKGF